MKPKKTVLVPIPMQLALAVARYYVNRERQYEEVVIPLTRVTVKLFGRLRVSRAKPNYQWDKTADCKHVFDVSHQFGFGSGSCMSGTFVFVRKGYLYVIDEQSWPKAKRERVPESATKP